MGEGERQRNEYGMGCEVILNKLKRSLDPAPFNEIANHPEVRPWLGGADGPLDLSAVVCNPSNVCFLSEVGGFIAHKLMDARYEVHSLFLPEGRGGLAIECAREGLAFMFCATDCTELVTKCPDGNGAALGLARLSGFQEQFRRERAWASGADRVGVSYQALSLQRWIARDAECLAGGHWFHEKLTAAKGFAGSELPVHDDDDAHDRFVGASVRMVLAGNPRKAVWSYNRWAVFAGYAPISLLSEAPPVIDVMDAVVAPHGDDMEVLLCR